ncbi:MAG: VCBS repeat-containing protein [Byssovorax sp.]
MPFRRAPLLLSLCLPLLTPGLLSCADLPTIEEDRCGNGFIEPGEDCDDFGATAKKPGTVGSGASCNAPGVPNQCHFHCEVLADCEAAPVSAKGSGWRCGVDNVCRRPQGADSGKGTFFEPQSSLVPGSADELFAGDFDGDGRKDVLAVGQAGFDVHYFTPGGAEAKSVSVPGAPIVPAIGKLTSTLADDFTIDVGRGVGVMLGGVGETLDPASYQSLDIKKRYGGAPDDMRLFILDSGGGPRPMALASAGLGVQLIEAAADPKGNMNNVVIDTAVGFGRKTLLGNIPVGFLSSMDDHQRFLLAYEGVPSVSVVEVVVAMPNPPVVTRAAIKLQPGLTIHGGAFFADVDLDGNTDVLVGAAKCGKDPLDLKVVRCVSAELLVAYGDGKGAWNPLPKSSPSWDAAMDGFAGDYFQTYPDDAPPKIPPLETEIGQYLPLAIGRINNDASLDYVNAFGIYVSDGDAGKDCPNSPNGHCRVEGPSAGGQWSEARIADFNANGRADVVGVSPRARGIDFFNGTGTGVFNTFSLPTEGVPRNLAVGDFDGDFVADLAFDSKTSRIDKDATSSDVHKVFVAFGNPSGAPSVAANMGEVPNLLRLVGGSISSFGNDAATELVLLSGVQATYSVTPSGEETRDTDGADWKVGLALGNGYRQLQAPLLFFAPGSIALHGQPVASAIGLFDGDAHADLAAIVARRASSEDFDAPPPKGVAAICDFSAELWMLPALGEAAIDPPADSSKRIDIGPVNSSGVDAGFLPVRRLVETVPINADGVGGDELLIALPAYDGCDHLGPFKLHGELLLAHFYDKAPPTITPILTTVGANEFLLRLRVGDLDGDGKQDIAALDATFDFAKGQLAGTKIVVLRGKGDGTFEPRIDVPIVGYPVDLALVNADGDSAPEIVGVADFAALDGGAALFVVAWDKANSKQPFKTLLPTATATTTTSATGSMLEGPTSLAGGDFDGDGVDDVAVAVAGGIRLFKGVAK